MGCSSSKIDGQAVYLVDNSELQSEHHELAFRQSKDLEDEVRVKPLGAQWGTTVRGVDAGDGWIKVGRRFLPMKVGGATVLIQKDAPVAAAAAAKPLGEPEPAAFEVAPPVDKEVAYEEMDESRCKQAGGDDPAAAGDEAATGAEAAETEVGVKPQEATASPVKETKHEDTDTLTNSTIDDPPFATPVHTGGPDNSDIIMLPDPDQTDVADNPRACSCLCSQ